jgi:hypothetical protein
MCGFWSDISCCNAVFLSVFRFVILSGLENNMLNCLEQLTQLHDDVLNWTDCEIEQRLRLWNAWMYEWHEWNEDWTSEIGHEHEIDWMHGIELGFNEINYSMTEIDWNWMQKQANRTTEFVMWAKTFIFQNCLKNRIFNFTTSKIINNPVTSWLRPFLQQAWHHQSLA